MNFIFRNLAFKLIDNQGTKITDVIANKTSCNSKVHYMLLALGNITITKT